MMPRAASNSSTMRRPSGKRKYSHTACPMISAGNRYPVRTGVVILPDYPPSPVVASAPRFHQVDGAFERPASKSATDCPSTPAAPWLAFTFLKASQISRFGMSNGFALSTELLLLPVGSEPRLNNAVPSVQPHYSTFIPTTDCSAPVPRIGTLVLAGFAAWTSPFASGRQVLTFLTRA